MAQYLRSCIINSDEFTSGEDWHFHPIKGKDMLWLAANDITVQITDEHTKNPGYVIIHRLATPPTIAGRLRRITYHEAEDHQFIIKLGDQKNAVYYGVDPV